MTDAGPLVVRPRRLVLIARLCALAVVVTFGAVASLLRRGRDGAATFHLTDQVAMFVLGLLIAGGVLLLTRPRVEADSTGVRVRNVLGETVLPWQVVMAVRLDDGTPWAVLDLADDDQVSVLAVQANDGERAVQAVLELRRLLRASRASGGRAGPPQPGTQAP